MAEDPSELREAIRVTRSNMAETIDALGEKVDAKARGAKKVNDVSREARAKASEIGDRVQQAVHEQARPGVAMVADRAKSTTSTVGGVARDRPVVVAGAVLAVLVLFRWGSRLHRRQA
jgi:hypothetical protein